MNTHRVRVELKGTNTVQHSERQDYQVAKSTDTGARPPGFEAQLYHLSNSVTLVKFPISLCSFPYL